MDGLKFTFGVLKALETRAGNTSFEQLLITPTMANILLFVQYGLGCTEEEAIAKIEEFLEGGKTLKDLFILIYKSLQDGGFLDRAVDIEKLMSTRMEQSSI